MPPHGRWYFAVCQGILTLSAVRIFTILLASLLVLGACSGDAEVTGNTVNRQAPSTTAAPSTVPATTTTTTSTTTTLPPVVSPLNGLAVEDPEVVDRRVLAVKIDNHWNARPQSGIEDADAVFELLVEADLTRFIAMFHDNDATFLGPMRSGRPTDPTLIKQTGGTFTISGAQPWVSGVINRAGVPLIGEVRPATFRISSRRAPHNLYVDTEQLRVVADDRGYSNEPPPDLFEWGPLTDGGEAATEVFMDWSSATRVTWVWTGEAYERMLGDLAHNWRSEDGETEEPISADTLVVLFAPRYWASGSTGSSVPAMDTVGEGIALVFAEGTVIEGMWARETIEEPFALADAAGDTIAVPPGKPWISVFPDSRTVSW